MFKDNPDGARLASDAADFFSDDQVHGSHSRGIHRDALRELSLVIDDLEGDPLLQDAVLSVHHATMHTMSNPAVVKIVENNLGRAFVNLNMTLQVMQAQAPPAPPAPPPPANIAL